MPGKEKPAATAIAGRLEIVEQHDRIHSPNERKGQDESAIVAPPLAPADELHEGPAVKLEDFVAYMPTHGYIFTPTREFWPGASVNARIAPIADGAEIIAPSKWLDAHSPVEQATWAPGEQMCIRDRLISDGGWIERSGCTVFNLYRPPSLVPKPGSAKPWLDHLRRVYPDDADHIVMWLAHRVQQPQEKINHALVFGGVPGIGKDTILEPIKQAIDPWNFAEASPRQMLGRFNGFLKSVILRVSEARDLGDVDRFAFYDHLKAYTAAPPDVLRIDEKHLREYAALNVVGIIITSNHKTDGIYLPPDDRRHYVAWSDLELSDIAPDYFANLYGWFANGGNEVVAHYLATLDLSKFNPKAPPPKTQAFWEIVDASRTPEDAELNDVLDALDRPDVVTLSQIIAHAPGEFAEWLRDRKSRGRIPHRFTKCGYANVRNPDAIDGMWKVGGKRQVIYGRSDLSINDRTRAAYVLTGSH